MALRSFNNPQARFLDFFSKTGTDASGEVPLTGIVATGGVISDYTSPPGAVYRAHVFTSSGTFSVSSIGGYGSDVEYLVVAGGGGGGSVTAGQYYSGAGGGGAGGFRTNVSGYPAVGSAFPVSTSPGSYTITVGGGGAGGSSNGGNSSFGPITSVGGGRGATTSSAPVTDPSHYGIPGGSGGGAAGRGNPTPGGAGENYPGSTQQGFPGSPSPSNSGGGPGGVVRGRDGHARRAGP